MGAMWGALFTLGLMIPLLVLVASGWLVIRLARRLGALVPGTRPAWQWLGGHVALGTVAEVAAEALFEGGPWSALLPFSAAVGALCLAAVPFYLYRSVQRAEDLARSGQLEIFDRSTLSVARPGTFRDGWGVAALFVATGVALPWLTGLGVKIYLDARGRPTLPVSDFLNPEALPVLLVQTLALWAFPFLVLASAAALPWRVGFGGDPLGRASMLPLWLSYAAGVASGVVLFIGVFWQFDAITLIVPLGMYLVPPMAIGYAIGWWIVRHRRYPHPGRA